MANEAFQAALLERLDRLIERLDDAVVNRDSGQATGRPSLPDSESTTAWRWQNGQLLPVPQPKIAPLDQLLNIERQKEHMVRNTEQFLDGKPANNALLWGSRGTGKSTLVRALLGAYADRGLRLIEVEGHDLIHLPDIVAALQGRDERFILFTDDLSFEQDDPSYKALKSVLDGSIAGTPDNVLIYATSNRRHLMPERMSENREADMVDGELHPGETSEEKVSLSERFGLWLAFHPFVQDEYLAVVDAELRKYGLPTSEDDEETRIRALRWARQRGNRSGRVAEQFARDWLAERNS